MVARLFLASFTFLVLVSNFNLTNFNPINFRHLFSDLVQLTNFSRSYKVEPLLCYSYHIMAKYFYSPIKQKVVLLLAAGFALGFSRSPKAHLMIWKELPKAWKEIDRITLRRIVKEFKYKRLVDFKEAKDGTATVILTRLGQHHALRYNPDHIAISKPSKWDKKWRIVVLDVPEKKRQARDALRSELRKLGFLELQKSVWIFPYDCQDAIDFLVELFEIRNNVRYIVTSTISHDADLRLHFDLV